MNLDEIAYFTRVLVDLDFTYSFLKNRFDMDWWQNMKDEYWPDHLRKEPHVKNVSEVMTQVARKWDNRSVNYISVNQAFDTVPGRIQMNLEVV